MESDGGDATRGLFVAMSDNKTFHYYSWKNLEPFGKLLNK
jgi:hypothetical protein